MKIVPVTEELRREASFHALRRAWAEFLLHDPLSNTHWNRLYTERADFQFALVDDGRVLAEGNSIPVPEFPPAWRDAFPLGFDGREPVMLCALSILVDPDLHGRGLSRVMLEHMRSLAVPFGTLVAPVRPTLKERYPLTPIERYARWRRDDGFLFDPWLRTHERLGGELLHAAADAMWIEGSVAEWEQWAAMAFPETGDYVVPGALVPVAIDRGRDVGVYREPCVWMRHTTKDP